MPRYKKMPQKRSILYQLTVHESWVFVGSRRSVCIFIKNNRLSPIWRKA